MARQHARTRAVPPSGPSHARRDARERVGLRHATCGRPKEPHWLEPRDFRRGIAAFQVGDLEVSKRVFSVCGTSTRVFAMHEHLPLGGGERGELYIHVVESPYEDFDDDLTRLRACGITLDRSRSTAAWHVDGRRVYEAHGTLIPERARIGFGIYTMLPIRDGRSRSLDGQGMNARWRRFRVRGVDA
jgi:hypothetical protein